VRIASRACRLPEPKQLADVGVDREVAVEMKQGVVAVSEQIGQEQLDERGHTQPQVAKPHAAAGGTVVMACEGLARQALRP
jgi:hypothetical protein